MRRPSVAIDPARETVDHARGAIAAAGERVIASPVAITSFGVTTHLFAGGDDLICRDHSHRGRWQCLVHGGPIRVTHATSRRRVGCGHLVE